MKIRPNKPELLPPPRSAERRASSGVVPAGPRRYEDLRGASGREVHFRPPRYPSSEFGPVGVQVDVALGEARYACALHDVSQNGVAFEWRDVPRLRVGDHIPFLRVSFDGHEAYRGAARIGSVRHLDAYSIVGASFLDTLMNIDDVLHLRDVRAWGGAAPGSAEQERLWRVPGQDAFKARVAELRLLFQDIEEELDALEASLPWHVVHGEQPTPARQALIDRIRREVVDEILKATQAVHEALEPCGPSEHQSLKEFAQRYLHDYMMQSPWMRRAREKPLGYPGDYELMIGLYGDAFVGPTLFAKAMNVAYTSTQTAIAVRERKNVVKERLSRLLDEASPSRRPVRVLSIAAGPAEETYELLLERASIPHPLEIVLFEQDKRALSYSYGRLKSLVAKRWDDQVRIVYVHDAIKTLLGDPRIFSRYGEFDAVFACGLFDYLVDTTASSLCRGLHSLLAPGGTLYVGNMVPSSPTRWIMEFHCEWYLLYRERAEMLAFARAGAPEAELAILDEPTGLNPFVTLTRPT